MYCPEGDFYIDPVKSVPRALITHAHSDHARKGCETYLCADSSRRLLGLRMSARAKIESVPYGQTLKIGTVKVSFHPAGHVLGSSQIRLEREGEVWVVSGDYKREPDPTCEAFEPVPCDVFITEATFGHPAYVWDQTPAAFQKISAWWQDNRERKRNSVLFCYSLGKAQRVLAELRQYGVERALLFGETISLTEAYREEKVAMIPTLPIEEAVAKGKPRGELILASSALLKSPLADSLGNYSSGFASGWMKTGAFGVRRNYDEGFVISDHADWPALIRTAHETGAERVLVHWGGGKTLVRKLRQDGLSAAILGEDDAEEERKKPVFPTQGELFSGRYGRSS